MCKQKQTTNNIFNIIFYICIVYSSIHSIVSTLLIVNYYKIQIMN